MSDDQDDQLDAGLRAQLQGEFPNPAAARTLLPELQPRMWKARARRRAMVASATTVATIVLVAGAFAAIPRQDDALRTAGPAGEDSAHSEASTGVPATTTSAAPTSTNDSRTSSTDRPSTTAPAVAPTTSVTDERSDTTAGSTAAPASSTEAPSTTDETSTTEATTTTVDSDQTDVIETACGSIEVQLDGSGIQLIGTTPDPGFSVEIKNSGPETVEVGFEREDDEESPHCEIHAENRSGELWTDIENDSG